VLASCFTLQSVLSGKGRRLALRLYDLVWPNQRVAGHDSDALKPPAVSKNNLDQSSLKYQI